MNYPMTVRAYHRGYVAVQPRHSTTIKIHRESDHSIIYQCRTVEKLTVEKLKDLIDSVLGYQKGLKKNGKNIKINT